MIIRSLLAPFIGLALLLGSAGAAATNTPLACTIMGVELFGSHYTVYFMIACFLSYGLSGHSGIYSAQRLGTPKVPWLDIPTGEQSPASFPPPNDASRPTPGHDT